MPSSSRRHSASTGSPSGPVTVAFVISDGANVIDFAGAWEVFQDTARPRTDLNPASVAAVSPALAFNRTRRTRGSPSRNARTISALRS